MIVTSSVAEATFVPVASSFAFVPILGSDSSVNVPPLIFLPSFVIVKSVLISFSPLLLSLRNSSILYFP